MKFTLNWLKEYLDTNASLNEICEKLDQIGLEVEEVIDNGEIYKNFNSVVIEDIENHPDSDHLHICKVRCANRELLQIVCGAPNARKGLKTILAPIGSIIPNGGFKISKSKIRGVESCGMMCSEKELGLSNNHEGIIELDNNIQLGENIAKIKNIDDVVIDINITPNRGDCLGVYGIARDLSATGIGVLKPIKDYEITSTITSPLKCEIKDENCSEFLFRYIKNVKNCQSPDWMQERLKAVGINPKTALVDITNYIMLVLNRPLHCYDADKLTGNFVIRKSNGGEKFLALNKTEYELGKDHTLISDTNNNILGLGGVIGGEYTSTSIDTTNIVLECAVFEPISIATTARYLGINTDAKYRYERGVDKSTGNFVINYATFLINSICGGENSEIISGVSSIKLNTYQERTLDFDISNVELILGFKMERQEIIEVLNKLGYKVKENTNNLNILNLVIPSWRNDVLIKENVVEDIIRIYGYENLKEIKINSEKIAENNNTDNKLFHDKLWQITSYLSSKGMKEVISWSFMNEDLANEFAVISNSLKLQNPMSSELSYMRPSIIPNLMSIAKYNQDRSIENISIFEKGKIFINQTPEGQKMVIAGLRTGLTCEKDIYGLSREFDIIDVKKDLFDILKMFNISTENLTITNEMPDYYHPARSGAVKLGNNFIGIFGEIHPLKVNKIGLKHRINVFELYIDNLPKLKLEKSTQKRKFTPNDLQPIKRDFAFIVGRELEIGNILNSVKKVSKDLITNINLFDIYQGENIDADKKSVAFSITIQPKEKVLTTEEIDAISDKIIQEITTKFKGILRDK